MSTFIFLRTSVQVASLCGRLPLSLAIAGSVPVVKERGSTVSAWEELTQLVENKVGMVKPYGGDSDKFTSILQTSFNALPRRTQNSLLKMAVMAAGAVASIEMLRNLWEMKVRAGVPSTPGDGMPGNQSVDHVPSRLAGTLCCLCALCVTLLHPCCVSTSSCTPVAVHAQDEEDTQEEAKGLVERCLLQDPSWIFSKPSRRETRK